MDEPLTHEHFSAYLGKQFRFDDHPGTLVLRSVDFRPNFADPDAPRAPFTLIFQGPAGVVLPAGHYQAAVQGGPTFELHVMPIHTSTPDRQDYQAAFN
jgi:hypothetical protein